MKSPAIVSLLESRNLGVLESYVRDNPGTKVFASQGPEDAALVRRVAAAGGEISPFHALLTAGDLARAGAKSRSRSAGLEGLMKGREWLRFASDRGWPGEQLGAAIDARVRADLPEIATAIAALERIRSLHVPWLVVVNEDFTPTARAVVLWAKDRGVPTLHLSHSISLCEPFNVHGRIVSDVLAVFGERGAEGYLDVDARAFADRIRVTGNPAWDGYPAIVSRREAVRAELAARHGLPPSLPWVVLATTAVETQTAFLDEGIFENTLRAFLEACAALVDGGRRIGIIVKDRPPNQAFGSERVADLAVEVGIDREPIVYALGDIQEWVVAADVVVSMVSNVSVEALLASTPAVNLLTETDAALTPPFDAESGIVEAEGHELAAALDRILGDPDYRNRLRDRMRSAAPRYNLGFDGTATARVAGLMEELALPIGSRPRRVRVRDYSTSWRLGAPGRLAARGARALRARGRSLALRARGAREAAWLQRRAAGRLAARGDTPEAGLLSFITPVWNTPPKYLAALADSILGQPGGPPLEWVVLDNGSTDADTRAFLDSRIAPHPQVLFRRSDENLGIVGGTRRCLELATGRYVLPVDHDDRLYRDCAATVTQWLRTSDYPAAMYSDEDKLTGGFAAMPFLKPEWDPVLFANQCYTAHLDIVDREVALEVGAYTDEATEGSPDWDCLMRLHVAGHDPVHLPEILYSWRMHSSSTAFDIASKSFIHTSQRAVLERYLGHLPNPERFSLGFSPLFSGTSNWRLRRLPVEPRALAVVILGDESRDAALGDFEEYPVSARADLPRDTAPRSLVDVLPPRLPDEALIALLDARVDVTEPGWLWEALGLMERFPDTVLVGGRLLDHDDRVLAAGQVLGFEPACGCPDADRRSSDPGYAVWMHKQRSVSAVSTALCVFAAGFLRDLLGRGVPEGATWAGLEAWAAAHALREDRRVVYSPFIAGRLDRAAVGVADEGERDEFLAAHGEVLPDERWYSPAFGLTRETRYRPVEAEERRRQIARLLTPATTDRQAASTTPRGGGSA